MSNSLQNALPAFQAPATPLLQAAAWRRAGLALWQGFEAMSLSRARGELLRQARLREGTHPELARQLREAAAQSV